MADRGVLIRRLSDRASAVLGPLRGDRALANALLVAGSASTMVVDTMISPAMMVEARAEAERLGGRPVGYVLNTHGDADHLLGNGLFPEARVVAQRHVRALFEAPDSRERYAKVLADAKAAASAGDAAKPKAAGRTTDLRATDPEAAPTAPSSAFVLRPPDLTFDDRIRIDLGGLSALATYVGPAHSVADSIVWFEEESLLATGDLVFNGTFPLLRQHVQPWLDGLALAQSYHPGTVVPGHGPIGDARLLSRQLDILEQLRDAVAALRDAGLPPAEAASRPVPPALAHLPAAQDRWPAAVHCLYAHLDAQEP